MECILCTEPQQVRLAKALRYSVFCEEKQWIDPRQCDDGIEEDEHDELAVHFLVLEDGHPVGTARLLLGRHQKLPAAEYFDPAAIGVHDTHVVEISRLAIRRHSRSHDLRVFLSLMQAMWLWGSDNSMLVALAIADAPLFTSLQRLGIPALAISPEVEFLGSPCVPVAYEVSSLGEWCQRRLGNGV